MKKVRVRFPPSPTGYLHVGSLRTALYNYLFAEKNKADFVLRIEDTDRKRFIEGSLESLIKTLNWADLEYDEGVFLAAKPLKFSGLAATHSEKYPNIVEGGEYGPYIQSEKLEVYKKYAEELVKKGQAYYCFCEPERLEEMREKQRAQKKPPIYDRYCLRNVSGEEINKNLKSNCPYTIRLKIPENETVEFEDIVRGKVKFKTDLVDDTVLLKSDGFPTYHLANVVDDYEMKITHVIRGEEWLSSVPKHLLLYEYFGWEPPKFAHLPLLLNADRSKLSKRQGDVAVEDYIKKGYLKEAIINFVAMLGWNPGEGSTQEIFTLQELTQKFDLSRVHKSGAVFDIKKFNWINSQWIKKITLEDLYERSKQFWKEKDFYINASEEKKSQNYIKKILSIERDRLGKLSEVGENNKFFFQEPNYGKEILRWKELTWDEIRASLEKSLKILDNIKDEEWERGNLKKILMDAAGEKPTRNATHSVAGGRGELLWPLRAALTGVEKSPSPFEVAWVLGKKEALKRIKKAMGKIK